VKGGGSVALEKKKLIKKQKLSGGGWLVPVTPQG
jgi:hypothetical protein